MPYYKLTDKNMQTYLGFQWKLNKWKKVDGQADTLCNYHWLHCYNDPMLALLLNPIHAGVKNPRIFRINVRGKKLSDCGLKFGFTQMRLVEEVSLKVTMNQRIAFGILCAKEVYSDKEWNYWADNWLSGKDRSVIAASRAATCHRIFSSSSYAAYAATATAAYADDAADAIAYAAFATELDLVKTANKVRKDF